MSHIARELKMLFYLNRERKRFVKIDELADLLEVSPRQVRRYRDDLEQCGFYIDGVVGENGGYQLMKPLSKSLMIPENLMLALNVASKSNVSLIKALNELPVVPKMKEVVYNSNEITDSEIDKLVIIEKAIVDNNTIIFDYLGYENKFEVKPYKLLFTNHTYYLRGEYKDIGLRTYDIDKIENIEVGEAFTPNEEIIIKTDEELEYYGIKDGEIVELNLKYFNENDMGRIDRVFEYKGTFNKEEMTYTLKSRSIEETFFPIFSLTNKVEILTEEVKREYNNYLLKQIKK